MKQIFILLLLAIVPFQAKAAEPLRVTYGLFASGFHVVDMTGTYDVTNDKYDLKMDLQTIGMLSSVAPWAGIINSNGINKGAQSTPLKHSFASTWQGETEITQFTFNKEGRLVSHSRKENDGTVVDKMPDVDVYSDNPTDMLSALFRAMSNDSCSGTYPALDGKRRFDMVFSSKGRQVMKPSSYSTFSGNAEMCEIEIKPVGGKWREKPRGWMSIQEQAKGNGQLPRIWFGKVRSDMPRIPVRFFIKTDYGAMVMHLKAVTG